MAAEGTDAGGDTETMADREGRASLSVLSAEFDLPKPAGPLRPYVICASPRSGSTLLTTLLHGTGRMGVPAEYFNPRFLQPALGRRLTGVGEGGQPHAGAYLAALLANRSTANGVFGVKVLFSQLQVWMNVPPFRRMLANATFVWLRRRDQMGQALSMALAQATQVWHREAGDGEAAAVMPAEPTPPYDAVALRRALGIVLAEDYGWQQFFLANAIKPMTLTYEDLVADPDRACRALAEAIGVADLSPITMERAITRPTAGKANEEWRRHWGARLRFR